mgnify:CR=1 FL=1
MKSVIYIFLTLVVCNSQAQDQSKAVESSMTELPYSIEEAFGGIAFEVFNDSITDENKYNYNNSVLVPGSIFTYKFRHEDKNGEVRYFEKYKENDKSVWRFVEPDHPNAVKSLSISVLQGNPMKQFNPDYNQTCLGYQLQHDESFNMSGAVENEANMWIHPPRDSYFSILELNPFPYIKAPYKAGTQWDWELTIGSQWGDARWKEWEGNIVNNYTYKILGSMILKTTIGSLECLIVEATATSSLGETSLISYFNKDYGFVKLEYNNIDGSKTFLDITRIDKPGKDSF